MNNVVTFTILLTKLFISVFIGYYSMSVSHINILKLNLINK
jgi:hypothetical protein